MKIQFCIFYHENNFSSVPHGNSQQCHNELQCTSKTCQFTNFSKFLLITMERFNSGGGRNPVLQKLHDFHKVFISTLRLSLQPHSIDFYHFSKQTSTQIVFAAKEYRYQTRTPGKNLTSTNSSA